MDMDALMSSMKQQMYGAVASDDEAEVEETVADEPQDEQSSIDAAKGIWNPHVTASADIMKRAVKGVARDDAVLYPGTEAARWKAVRSLQSRFERLCAKHLGEHWNPAFERWLFSRKLACAGGDPLLPWGEEAMKDPGLESELVAGGTTPPPSPLLLTLTVL
jgi:hypothetical protein